MRGVVGPRRPGARNIRHLPRYAPSAAGNRSYSVAPEDGTTVGGHRGSGPQGGTNPALPGRQRAARRDPDGGAHPHARHHTSGLNFTDSYFTLPINFGN